MRVHDRLPTRSTSVEQDWCGWLPPEKFKVFGAYVQQLECRYSMLSVTLNEALELRRTGFLAKSYQALSVSPALCTRLTDPLSAMLRAFSQHAAHYGTAPNTAPLDPVNFRSTRGQSCARTSNLLSRILLTQRAHFLHKIEDLRELVEDLGRDFCHSAEELLTGVAHEPALLWEATNADHFDLNTCFRESLVLLKSFLRALPEDQLSAFESSVATHMNAPRSKSAARQPVIRHRRMPNFAGE